MRAYVLSFFRALFFSLLPEMPRAALVAGRRRAALATAGAADALAPTPRANRLLLWLWLWLGLRLRLRKQAGTQAAPLVVMWPNLHVAGTKNGVTACVCVSVV